MGFLLVRAEAISTYLIERFRWGLDDMAPSTAETADGDEAVFILDGVGGFQFAPVLVRRALRLEGACLPIVLYVWQYGLAGEIWTDLMWHRRNRVMGGRLARRILAYRRRHPHQKIHLIAFSGGCGIAVFACESLHRRRIIETLVLACPALSPTYNLGPALSAVRRAYALVSSRDRFILGLGTTLFGTTDRCHEPAAGCVGFQIPQGAAHADIQAYERLREIRWAPDLKRDGHRGGHTSWASTRFLRRHLLPLLHGTPALPVATVPCERVRSP